MSKIFLCELKEKKRMCRDFFVDQSAPKRSIHTVRDRAYGTFLKSGERTKECDSLIEGIEH